MNEVRIELTEKDIQTAINDYLHKKYPNFQLTGMWLKYNGNYCGGHVNGYLKDREGK
jgi:hypothetical protein